ncbi:serine/threonine-protein kinase [uncultured Flavonifractor sp.]|uniref:serine/threonine-protein kinase n=1 Tax=uncultured Flavonifractor sp. TaxID=1193534 RepID=UPI00260FBB36|nr:serine/threonine-protein kinase [uncultured Flavonifractor sp.]
MNGFYKPGDIVLGKWMLTRFIGEGSFGKVFEAKREDFGRTYKAAIKIVTIPQSQSEIQSIRSDGMDEQSVTSYFRGFVEEMVDEFDLMEKLKGTANVVGYEDHEVIQHTNQLGWDILIRMELLTPLLHKIETGSLSQSQIVRLGMDLCRALELCHNHKILHRDIKPENIFISDNGDYKLGDFGIARTVEKTTGGLSKKGTYTYMAPEVYKGEPYGFSADLYSLGIVLYWLSNSNRAPFFPPYPQAITYSDREAALRRRMSGEAIPAPCNADSELSTVILKACAYAPKDRYASPRELYEALQDLHSGESRPQERIYCETEIPEQTESIFSAAPMAHPINKDDATAYLFEPCQLTSHERPIEKEKKKTKRISLYAVVGMLCVALSAGGLCISGSFSDGDKSEPDQISEDTGETESKLWSEWMDELPLSVLGSDDYEIEEETLYRSREKETTTSSKAVMDGWEQYDTSVSMGEYGAWSNWSTTPISASDTRKVEEATQYRYRDLQTTTSTSNTLNGWTLSDQTSTWSDYGAWSNWQISPVSSSDSRQVEKKTQYRYRIKETCTSKEASLPGWTQYDKNVTYGEWSDWTTTPISETANREVQTYTTSIGTRYYLAHYCTGYVEGALYQTSSSNNTTNQTFNQNCIYHELGWFDSLDAFRSRDDGNPGYLYYQGGNLYRCSNTCYTWYIKNKEDVTRTHYRSRSISTTYLYERWGEYTAFSDTLNVPSNSKNYDIDTREVYRYRERSLQYTYYFSKWGDWSSWNSNPVYETANRQVETQQVYRYADKGQGTVYYFWRWGEWSDFSEEEVSKTESVDVEEKTVYRYKER